MATIPADLAAVDGALRQILRRHADRWLIQRDDDEQLYLDTHHLQPELLAELATLTQTGFDSYAAQGHV